MDTNKNLRSFTLIELLVVLALVAILSVVVILTLNPAELLKQARDSNRLSDLATINTALNLFSTDVTSGFMGTSTIVYVSIPSASPTCSGLGLPSLPVGYTYNCATSQNLRNIDGTGWIPVNFQRISSNSPISQLPIDPINTTSTRLYYTYVPGGSWELNASIEASKNKLGGSNDLTSKDGGNAVSTYELGNNLNLNPIETGDSSLVGYWNFEEGPNATSTDRSGYGNHGTWYGTSTAQQHYATGKVGQYAGYFNGGSDWVRAPVFGLPKILLPSSLVNNGHGFSAWVYALGYPGAGESDIWMCQGRHYMRIQNTGQASHSAYIDTTQRLVYGANINLNKWTFVVGQYNNGELSIYIDGFLSSTVSYPGIDNPENDYVYIGSAFGSSAYSWFGYVDDIKIYKRALSAAEILALYNANK